MHWVNEKILKLIQSNNEYDQLKVLNLLGTEREIQPTIPLISCTIQLLRVGAGSVKESALFALGIHWVIVDIFPEIIEILKNTFEDEDARIMAATSISSFANYPIVKKYNTSSLLASIVLNESESNDIRGAAYLSLLQINGKINDKKELAKYPFEINQMDVDWEWVNVMRNKVD